MSFFFVKKKEVLELPHILYFSFFVSFCTQFTSEKGLNTSIDIDSKVHLELHIHIMHILQQVESRSNRNHLLYTTYNSSCASCHRKK